MAQRRRYTEAERLRALELMKKGTLTEAQAALSAEGIKIPIGKLSEWRREPQARAAPDLSAPPAPPADSSEPGDADPLALLGRQVVALEALAKATKEAGNVTGFTTVTRCLNATVALTAKLTPPKPPDNDENPDVRAAARAAVAKLHDLIDRALEDGN
jgi:hypothetical protein